MQKSTGHAARTSGTLAPTFNYGLPHSDCRCAAALSGVMSRCGMPSISNPTMNFRIVAERRSGG